MDMTSLVPVICPSIYEYTCVTTPLASAHGSLFPCRSQYTTSGYAIVTQTDFRNNTIDVETSTMDTNLHLFAIAMVYVTPVRALNQAFAVSRSPANILRNRLQ